MTGTSAHPTVYTSRREQIIPDYPGGPVTFDLGSVPAGDYSLHIVVSCEVASGVSPPEVRNLSCALATVPASPLAFTQQTTFPSFTANGNAFTQMPIVATLSAPAGLALRLTCDILPTANTPDVRLTTRLVAIEAGQVTQL
ncbi:hypothetical protein [Actinomycetospora callitridis]|jgi:hypothetical protein|uniref:hypothetical protein n=1 Tax=Actinomycetospora callitridis TaxID=913944 RepID=UPI002366337C|nr:hypothetical protein [Actinomycetospora callitridis]MDD7919057.1 hypothetical protein [Actinomycetospora callitridis]